MMETLEFADFGFLQEANRKFFHPLGLMLMAESGDKFTIMDKRDQPGGMAYVEQDLDSEKIKRVQSLRDSKAARRVVELGAVEQLPRHVKAANPPIPAATYFRSNG